VRCWNCQAETHGRAFCPACGKISPRAPGATHFDAFGLAPSFDVDVPALDKQLRELSLKLHPDRFAQADARERRLSLEQTTALNEAYKVLKDPVRRGFYLLALRGVDLDRDETPENRELPAEFLEEVMELRETLAEAHGRGDVAKAQEMGEDVRRRQQVALKAAMAALDRAQGSGRGDPAVQEAAHQLARVRYFARFLEEVGAIEEEALA
jgi:molecular chaperone HscB